MFKPNSNSDRLNYGQMLMPPVGYKLEQAIGTTYSLDLETLTAISISLGLAEETDSELIKNPVSMLNALQKVSERILIFCEAGQIKFPKNASPLCLILEKMVIPVTLPYDKNLKRYPAFHPKMWVLDYINDDKEHFYRVAVLSRNLTFDRSWDISVALEGEVSRENLEGTKPIIDFLTFLKKQIDNDFTASGVQRKALNQMIKSLGSVSFYTDDKVFSEFCFMPLGIGRDSYDIKQDMLFTEKFDELVIMSPFLSENVISEFNREEAGRKDAWRTLITRKKELSKLKKRDVDNFDVFVLKDDIVDGESEISEEMEEKQLQDIHAKIYLTRRYSRTNLYLGSMNASYAAINKNVELMVRLDTMNRYLNEDSFLRDIFGGEWDNQKNPFELVDSFLEETENGTDEKDKLERLIKDICRMSGKGYVSEENGKYFVKLDFETDKRYENVLIRPLRSNKETVLETKVSFKGLDMLQLSEFYVITVLGECEPLERVIMIPTTGLPEDRDKEVVSNVVKDKRTFIEYVAFVLGDDYILSSMENHKLQRDGVYNSNIQLMPAVYEKMLKAALEEPDKLSEIGYIMKMIENNDIITDEFRNMYETFCKTLKLR